MKKILLVIGLMFSAAVAQAGPVEELVAAFGTLQNAGSNDRVQPQAVGQTVIRGYLATQNGFNVVSSATQSLGTLISKSQVVSAAASLGYTFVANQRNLDIYSAPPSSPTVGFFMLVYYDANGFASELYLIDDKLP